MCAPESAELIFLNMLVSLAGLAGKDKVILALHCCYSYILDGLSKMSRKNKAYRGGRMKREKIEWSDIYRWVC
jgi:hypothetical protein